MKKAFTLAVNLTTYVLFVASLVFLSHAYMIGHTNSIIALGFFAVILRIQMMDPIKDE